MPRIYFDVQAGAERMSDPDGFELDSLVAAEHEATYTAVTLARDWLPRTREICVEVRDEQRQLRPILTVVLTIDRSEYRSGRYRPARYFGCAVDHCSSVGGPYLTV